MDNFLFSPEYERQMYELLTHEPELQQVYQDVSVEDMPLPDFSQPQELEEPFLFWQANSNHNPELASPSLLVETPSPASTEQSTDPLSSSIDIEQLPKRGRGRPRKHPLKDPNAPKRGAGRPKGKLDSYKRLAKGEKAQLSKEERKGEVKRRKLEHDIVVAQEAAQFVQPSPDPSSSFWRGTSSG